MTQRLIKHLALLAGAAALLGTAACTPTESYWSEVQAPKQNKIEPVRLLHDVRFATGNQVSAAEAAQLENFLVRNDIGYGDRVYVLTDPSGTGPSAQRSKAVLERMAQQGVWGVSLASPEAQPGLVRVVVNRYVVVPPNCPDWSKPATSDYSNTPMSNLGCANTSNLGLMVADPSELIRGRTPGPADATGSALAIQRYRTDKVKPLQSITTGTGQ